MDEISSEGTSKSVGILFLWAVVCADSGVCWFLMRWDFIAVDPRDCVGSWCGVLRSTITKAGKFFGEAILPDFLLISL